MQVDKLLSNLLNSSSGKGALSGAASGALVSMLMHPKSRKRLGKNVVRVGGAAALAGVGYMAYKKWQESQEAKSQGAAAQAAPSPTTVTVSRSAPAAQGDPAPEQKSLSGPPLSVEVTTSLSQKLVLSMIAAANADGRIDDKELDGLMNSLDSDTLSPAEKAQLTKALNNPPPLEDVAATADSPEEAAEIYAASLAAIDPDTPAEHLYLRRLARALGLEAGVVAEIHAAS